MTQTTENPPVSGLRVLDIAHRIVSELGTWQYHPALSVRVCTNVGTGPEISLHLNQHETDAATRRVWMDDLEVLLGEAARVQDAPHGVLATLGVRDWRGTGVTVYASEYVTEVAR